MQPDRFRPLADAEGPFASVYFDDSHDTGTCSCAPAPDLCGAKRFTRASTGGGHDRFRRVARSLRHPQWYRCHEHPGTARGVTPR
jgi:hypothetical protein